MRNLLLALFMISTLLSCKKKTTGSTCEDTFCTADFRALMIQYLDNKGVSTEVKDFSVTNQRTGEKLIVNQSIAINSGLNRGYYVVIDDGHRKDLSEAGDDLKITATSEITNQTKSVIMKVKGGKCACHIQKVSGPENVIFD